MKRPSCVTARGYVGTETIADLENLKFIQIVRLCLVVGHEQVCDNETKCLLQCEKVNEVSCMMNPTGGN